MSWIIYVRCSTLEEMGTKEKGWEIRKGTSIKMKRLVGLHYIHQLISQDGKMMEYIVMETITTGIMIRRNIVLDESDQRYQLSLGLTKCTYSTDNKRKPYATAKLSNTKNNNNEMSSSQCGILDIELCLLTMEEDEVDDSGFPTFVNDGDDDEALICTSDDKIHSCVEAVVRVVSLSELDSGDGDDGDDRKMPAFGSSRDGDTNASSPQVREISLSRGMIGRDGSVRFRTDLTKALGGSGGSDNDDELQVVKLRFSHADTGAVLELQVPSKSDTDTDDMEDDGEIEYCGTKKNVAKAKNDGSRFLLDDHDDEEDDEPNEYEDDGFVVNGSHSEDESSSDSDDDDDEGECQICKNGGDLIICDGGDEEGGCGDMYHLSCIGRSVVPPGDWICSKCANEAGITVGIEGHEYEAEGSEDDEVKEVEAPGNNQPLTIDDSDDDEEIVLPKKKRLKRTILEPESDSD